ncbi:sensor histidine kinase [Hyalangium versicolor]|uniref:sensor histidine kinase n=1 Tax=Hyalangium versicolor TaxID=2861190 RepID=UPI001CCC3AD6|nr:ATP-binding protein [Hyalangium versicolor]
MSPSSEVDASTEHLRRELNDIRKVGGFIILAVLFWEFRGQWQMVRLLVATAVVLGFIHGVFIEWVWRRRGAVWAEWMRMTANAVTFAVLGWGTKWPVALWLYLPFNMLWFDGVGGWERLRAIAYLVFVDVVALLGGCDPFLPLSFTALAAIAFLVADKRTNLHRTMMRQVLQQREQLQKAHERALEQEKLSSLGMMAAGVAHEINNPMSFVTSNVSSLYKELQRHQQGLPEPLQEYVTEVLPETLDGIRRVNGIVSDLRRFSRGDAEIPTEYDLNDEARAALRIAHGQLGHCKVETDLGELGRVVGRSRQIAQVLVNLLVNAGQATAPGGKVHLSTRQEGEWVRMEVRDTGSGMSPEVQSRLFQPFFTTKPMGMGTGLGLAVVHGIVTAHGGQVMVSSQPGEGTCFTVLLPREPPTEKAVSSGH